MGKERGNLRGRGKWGQHPNPNPNPPHLPDQPTGSPAHQAEWGLGTLRLPWGHVGQEGKLSSRGGKGGESACLRW